MRSQYASALTGPAFVSRPVSASTDHWPSSRGDGRRLQMWFTPKPAMTFRMSSVSPCCVPTFISALRAGDGCAPRARPWGAA